MGSTSTRILGIPCSLHHPAARKAVHDTLAQIQKSHPGNFARLRPLVREIQPYSDATPGDMGIWLHDHPNPDDPTTWHYGCGENTPGLLKLNEDMPLEQFPSMLAHELGHVATRVADLDRRGEVEDEWASELAADWWAYRWGFGKQIAKYRPQRAWTHHGGAPGSSFEVQRGKLICKYSITRSFVVRLIDTRPGDLLAESRR